MNDDKLEQMLLAERVLGGAMRDPAILERLVTAGVRDGEFEVEQHRAMWRQMLVSHERHQRADAAMLEPLLHRNEGKNEWKQWIKESLASAQGTIDDEALTMYVERLRHSASLRRMSDVVARITKGVGEDKSASEIAAEAQRELDAIVLGATSKRVRTSKELAAECAREMHEDAKPVPRARLGFPAIDDALGGGVRFGTVLAVGMDTGVGKTTFGKHFTVTMLEDGLRPMWFTMESKARDVWDGVLEMHAGVPLSMRRTLDGQRRFTTSLGYMSDAPLWIDDSESNTIEEISSKVHAAVRNDGVNVVLIDYWQDIERSTRHARDDLNYAHISKVTRRMAARYNVAVICFVQLRDTDDARRTTKNYGGPSEADIAHTRQFAKDSSAIIMGDRLKASDDVDLQNLTRLRLVKNRHDRVLVRTWAKYDRNTTRLTQSDDRGQTTSSVQVPLPGEPVIPDWLDEQP